MIHKYKNIKIHYEEHLDGDGRMLYSEFLRVIGNNVGKVNNLYEFCAGTAFLGFSLLEDYMCKNLVLSDIEEASIKCCKETIKENNLENKTQVYHSDCLKQMPMQKFDLVIGNPPHFSEHQNSPIKDSKITRDLISVDKCWKIHENFYKNIGKYLTLESSILFVENGRGSQPELFQKMIEEGGLEIVDIFKCNLNRPSKFYFMWVKKKT